MGDEETFATSISWVAFVIGLHDMASKMSESGVLSRKCWEKGLGLASMY